MAEIDFNEIRKRACLSDNKLLNDAGRQAFRNLLDPYCAEYESSNETRLEIIRQLRTIDVRLGALCGCYREAFRNRPDITSAVEMALSNLLEHAVHGRKKGDAKPDLDMGSPRWLSEVIDPNRLRDLA